MKLPRFLSSLALFFCFSSLLAHGEGNETDEGKEKDRSFRVAFSSIFPGLGKQLHFNTEEGYAHVPVNIYKISKPQKLTKEAATLDLFKEAPVLVEGEQAPAPDLRVSLPAARKLLVVVFPRVTDGIAELDAHVIDESKFPAGSIYFFNPTNMHLGAVLGEEKVTINAGKEFLFRPPPIGDGKTIAVQIALHEEEGWRLFSSTRWHLAPTERHLLFFKVNPRTRRADYDSLTDYFGED